MSKSPRLSAGQVIKILVNHFGFSVTGQRGSHIKLRKFVNGRKIVTIVPNHREIKTGTLFGILELAEVTKEDFISKL